MEAAAAAHPARSAPAAQRRRQAAYLRDDVAGARPGLVGALRRELPLTRAELGVCLFVSLAVLALGLVGVASGGWVDGPLLGSAGAFGA